jgi:DNA-binding GntR family transcriptional regulator
MLLQRNETYARIKSDILTGSYGIREQLSVDDLARQYGVSKTPIREALGMLQAEGLVEIVPRVGYFTSRLTVKEIQDLFELRTILESSAVRLAASRITTEEQRQLREMHGAYVMGDDRTYLPWLQYNRQFHLQIAAATHNHELTDSLGHLLDRLQRVHWAVLDLIPFPPVGVQSHERVLQALEGRDAVRAEEAVVGHIRASRDAALKNIIVRAGPWDL